MQLVTFCIVFIYLLFLKVSRLAAVSQQDPCRQWERSSWSQKILENHNDLVVIIDPLGSSFISGLGSCRCLSAAPLKGHP